MAQYPGRGRQGPPPLTAHQRQELTQRLSEGAVQVDLARSYGVSQATISRLAAPSPFEASARVRKSRRQRDDGQHRLRRSCGPGVLSK